MEATNEKRVCVCVCMYVGVVLYSFLCPGLVPCAAALARTCARTATQKLGFVDLSLQSFRVDSARAFLFSVFVVHTATQSIASIAPLRTSETAYG